MSKSQRVTAAGQLAAVRLVHECRELGADADAWQRHLLGWLKRQGDGRLLSVGAVPGDPARRLELAHALFSFDWQTREAEERWTQDMANGMADHLAVHPFMGPFFRLPGDRVTRVRQELVSDRDWDRSRYVNEVLRPDGADEGLMSRVAVPAVGAVYSIVVCRASGRPPIPLRVGRLVDFLHAELAPHLGRSLWLTTQPNVSQLSPRLRQVLNCLLEGDSEKQAARRLGLAVGTVHVHVKRLYQHFGASSRAELLAVFLRRGQRPT
jgi:DNA-binding CsgD family transcriptional regulator